MVTEIPITIGHLFTIFGIEVHILNRLTQSIKDKVWGTVQSGYQNLYNFQKPLMIGAGCLIQTKEYAPITLETCKILANYISRQESMNFAVYARGLK